MPARPDPALAAAIAASKAYLSQSQTRTRARRETSVQWAERVAGYALDDWQADVMRADPSAQIAMVTSRQVGKSSTTALKASHIVSCGGLVIVVAPTQRQSSLLFRQIHDHLNTDGLHLTRESATELEAANGGRAICLPGDRPSTLRGHSLRHDGPAALLVDEAGYVKPTIWPAISPIRAAAPDAGLMLLSSPAGPSGELYRVWTEGGDDWTRVRVRAEDCPRISAAFLAGERSRLGDALYRQEYEAEFVAASRGVFDAQALAAMFGDAPVADDAEATQALREEDSRMAQVARAAENAARRGRQIKWN